MNEARWLSTVVGGILLLVVLRSTFFIVSVTEQAFLTQFGKPIRKPISEPGLKVKVPFLQKVHYFDRRFLEWDGHPNQVPTRDKRYISIDTYARWRIADPLLFFEKVTNEEGAQTRLDDVLDGATRSAVANHDLVDIVRSVAREDREAALAEIEEELDVLPRFQIGRNAIAAIIGSNAAPQLITLGIELLDVRFKRLNYEEDVKRKIFERMISERQRIAEKYRSEGEGESAKILGQRERELKTIESEAYRQAQEIQGGGDAEAAAIYADAYNQSPQSSEFYSFTKTLETYTTTLSERDWLVLSTQGDLFRYLRGVSIQNEAGTTGASTGAAE